MLIFGIMVVAMGILYSTISPTILGFDAKARSANQEFIFLSIGDGVNSLATSPVGSQGRVSITSSGGYYDLGTGYELYLKVTDVDDTVLVNKTQSIGEFTAQVNGSFQYSGGTKYLSRLNSEDVLLQNDTRELNTNYVAKVEYRYGSAIFTLYPMAWLDIVSTATGFYTVTITIIQLDSIKFDNTAASVDFPIEKDEWTLRLRKLSPIITTSTTPIAVPGPYKISHSINGNSTIAPEYFFGTATDNIITFRIVVIPILFSI